MASTMLLMCLIAAVSGTPLRQAEAASDLARALADWKARRRIEVPDGGVGDDSDATIKANNGDVPARSPYLLMSARVAQALPLGPASRLFEVAGPSSAAADASLSLRLARLQCFLC